MAWICRILLKLLGWQVKGTENVLNGKQCVVIVAPHTSNWDFPLGICVRIAYKLYHIKYLGKASLFRFPFGWFFMALGGLPVDRTKNNNMVQNYVNAFHASKDLSIVLAPEGTRKKVEHFKTGFYFIAKGASVPIILCKFDFRDKIVDFSKSFYPTENVSLDLERIESYYRGVMGKNPAYNF